MATAVKYPEVKVQLSGGSGNVFAMIASCRHAAKRAGLSEKTIAEFTSEVRSSGSYDEALQVMMAWFDVG